MAGLIAYWDRDAAGVSLVAKLSADYCLTYADVVQTVALKTLESKNLVLFDPTTGKIHLLDVPSTK